MFDADTKEELVSPGIVTAGQEGHFPEPSGLVYAYVLSSEHPALLEVLGEVWEEFSEAMEKDSDCLEGILASCKWSTHMVRAGGGQLTSTEDIVGWWNEY